MVRVRVVDSELIKAMLEVHELYKLISHEYERLLTKLLN